MTKLEFRGDRQALDDNLVLEVAMQVEPFDLNPANWGSADLELEEFSFTAPWLDAVPGLSLGG